jgi:hypothetical protein
MFESRTVFKEAYKLTRLRATEYLGFLVSDLDRQVSTNGLYSLPIAFGMKGNSLPCNILRDMIEHVLDECAKAGLYVPVCSFDGQWYRLAVRDQNDFPLTRLQLQKDIFHQVKRMSTSDITNKVCNMNVVNEDTVCEMVEVLKTANGLVVGSKQIDLLTVSPNIIHMIKTWKQGKLNKGVQNNEQTTLNEDAENTLSSLPIEVVDTIPERTLDEVLHCQDIQGSEHYGKRPIFELDQNDLDTFETDNNSRTVNSQNRIDSGDNGRTDDLQNKSVTTQECADEILNESDIQKMHVAVQNSKKSKKPWDMTNREFTSLFASAAEIDKHFTKQELIDALEPVVGKLASKGIKITASQTKRMVIGKLSAVLGDGSALPEPRKKARRNPKSLRVQTRNCVHKLPKDILCALYAEYIYAKRYESWTYEGCP